MSDSTPPRTASRGERKRRRRALFTRILVPTDLTTGSLHALRYAAWLAREDGAELHLVHAVEEVHDENAPGYSALDGAYDQLAEAAAVRLREEAHDARAGGSVAFQQHVLRGPRAAPLLLDYAERAQIDLIAMGTHGRQGAERFPIGSTAERVVRLARCSVLTVGPGGNLAPGLVKRVLASVDFSEGSAGVVSVAKRLSARWQARLHLLHVLMPYLRPVFLTDHPQAFEFSAARVERQARAELEQLYLRSPGPESSAVQHHVVRGRPATAITAFARTHEMHLLVQGARGFSAAASLPLGGVANEVVRTAPAPVFTVKPTR